jgi:hypothetical protein
MMWDPQQKIGPRTSIPEASLLNVFSYNTCSYVLDGCVVWKSFQLSRKLEQFCHSVGHFYQIDASLYDDGMLLGICYLPFIFDYKVETYIC